MATKAHDLIHVMRPEVVAWALEFQRIMREQPDVFRRVRPLSADGLTELRITTDQVEWRARGDHKTRWRALDVDALIDGVGVPLEESTGQVDDL